ncbi:MAG TPA: hypothetical protein VGS41_03680, partial [Chthonomonadales bacterium]|nr:hypothetical protein [Chthonomonadales bacterium]
MNAPPTLSKFFAACLVALTAAGLVACGCRPGLDAASGVKSAGSEVVTASAHPAPPNSAPAFIQRAA